MHFKKHKYSSRMKKKKVNSLKKTLKYLHVLEPSENETHLQVSSSSFVAFSSLEEQ